ncbi:MAG: hypothetical protein HXY20_05265 [Acidobacteria bacterium]|nr:hypothetical protein [Acidobacteriota bacterium]
MNAAVPYSPKQTCGRSGCHNYNLITQGFHFTQGAGEEPTADQKARIPWASSPGNFGGNWCSPAPLYRYLSPKHNDSPATMDMTAFTFFTSPCGTCHPGGGSAEYDRAGHRYDLWIRDPASGFKSGADNGFDGDYHKARWDETGVLEADCLLCHLPGYAYSEREKQIGNWNFRWAATAGARLASVAGSIKDGKPITVTYEKARFNSDGTFEPPMVRSPRNEACLSCHAQPGWKKRGANYRARTDVHLRAGLRCVDCHPAGSSAADPRIKGREVHQIAKGDDPGGLVRNDLDDTMLRCLDCHDTGRLGAPRARHKGLPPLHLDRISCQACHIPERVVMPIQFQASDVFNPAPKILSSSKRLWTFYGPDGKWRNHYGYLEMMGYDDKPTEPFRPALALYKGKIYPVNRVHSAWPGIEEEGRPGIMQPRMSDIYRMWTTHRADPSKYPSLAKIADDNGDGVVEVNRPDEIDALIEAVTRTLADIRYPMEGKRVVWVYNDRVYRSGTRYRLIEKHPWEASPYGNVHKYSHDIYPASAALGSKGCTDCHRKDAPFFFADLAAYPFDSDMRQVLVPQHRLLGYEGQPRVYSGAAGATATFFRWLTIVVLAALFAHIAFDFAARRRRAKDADVRSGGEAGEGIERFNVHSLAQHLLLMIGVLLLFISGVFLWGLRYPGALWAGALAGAWGGVDLWRFVHRAGGATLIFVCAYHLIYILIHPEGRRDFRLLLPRAQDFRDLIHNIRWYFGARPTPPQFGRFTYFEKFDYWAVFWGSVIMIGTGLTMWFPGALQRVAPSWAPRALEAFKEAHAHEALLAFLAIVIWHVYNVHLRPGRFPGSLLFLHGRMSREEMAREHPLSLEGRGAVSPQ